MREHQLNIRLKNSEKRIAEKRAAEWGLTLPEWVRVQLTSPAADWGMRRVVFPPDQGLDPADEGFHQVPNGWWKHGESNYWVWIDSEPPVDGYSQVARPSTMPGWRPAWEPHVNKRFASGLKVADDGDDA